MVPRIIVCTSLRLRCGDCGDQDVVYGVSGLNVAFWGQFPASATFFFFFRQTQIQKTVVSNSSGFLGILKRGGLNETPATGHQTSEAEGTHFS